MTYFSKFPLISYNFDDKNRKNAVDILVRFAIKKEVKDIASLFIRYQMKDGERVQDISQRIYGSPQLHWIIYLLNDIHNPYTELPLNQSEFDSMIQEKYKGQSLYLNVLSDETTVSAFEGNFTVGETVRNAIGIIENGYETLTYGTYEAKVLSWNPTFRQLVVDSEINLSSLNNHKRIVGLSSGAKGTIQRRVEHAYSVHHFENEDGLIINPLPGPLTSGISPLEGYVSGSQNVGVKVITNYEYEELLNEEKRKIKILRPEYVQDILSDMEKIFL